MTVANINPSISYIENDVTVTHAVPWRFEPGTLVVKRILVTGAEIALVEGADYSVTGGSTDAGGSITKSNPGVVGATLLIERYTPRAQGMAYPSTGTFPARSHEKALDRLTMMAQEQDNRLGDFNERALLVPIGEVVPPLARAPDRALKSLWFDALGNPTTEPETLPTIKGDPGDLTPEAQAVLDAALRLLARVSEMANVAASVDLYDLADEFLTGAIGDYWIIEKPFLFKDIAGTDPVTATGDLVACIKSRRGNANYDLVVTDLANRGTYFEAYGLGFVRMNTNQGYRSRGTVPMTVASFLAAAFRHGGNNRYIFGFDKNTNSRHVLAGNTNVRVAADTDGNAPDLARSWVTAASADGTAPKDGPVSVFTSLLADGIVDCVLEDSLFRGQLVERAVEWVNGDSVTDCYIVLNATSSGTPNADASCDFYGGMVKSGTAPVSREGIVAKLQSLSRPEITEADRVVLVVSDSTGDDIDTTAQEIDEPFFVWARDYLTAAYPDNCILYRRWTRLADTHIGYERFSNATLAKRTFVINVASAGSQPDYFFAERFSRAIGWLPKIDAVIVNHGHNLPTQDAAILAHPKRNLYRAGIYMQALDKLRSAYAIPKQAIVATWPVRTPPGDTRIDTNNDSVQLVADSYGDMAIIDLNSLFIGAGLPVEWYAPDDLHLAAPGALAAAAEIDTVYDGITPKPFATPALISQRRIAYDENLLVNGAFEQWAGGLPTGWTLFGDAIILRSNERIGRGQTAQIIAANGGLQQVIDCTALQGQDVVLSVYAEALANGDLGTGALQFLCNGAATIGDGRWKQLQYQSWDAMSWRYLHFPVPADATTLTIRIFAGETGSGTLWIDRAILAPGIIPRDFIQ